MATTPFRGANPGATLDEPNGNNGGGCDVCAKRPAQVFDADLMADVCRVCAQYAGGSDE